MSAEPTQSDGGFEAMGKPIPDGRRAAALDATRDMLPETPTGDRWGLVGAVADCLERDDPARAQKAAIERGLDLTGTYRLMAHLLAGPSDG